jgi:putative cell wall-binding protein
VVSSRSSWRYARPITRLLAVLALAATVIPATAGAAPSRSPLPEFGTRFGTQVAPGDRAGRAPTGSPAQTTISADYVDTCHDATDGAFDVRRLYFDRVNNDAVLTAVFCPGTDLAGFTDHVLRWDTGATFEIVRQGPGGPYQLHVDGDPVPAPEADVQEVTGWPTPAIEARFRADRLLIPPDCDPQSQTDCLRFAFESLSTAGGPVGDRVPNADGDRMSWPNSCNGAVAGNRATVLTTPGRGAAVAGAIRAAGYPVVVRGDRVEVTAGVDASVLTALVALPDVMSAAHPRLKQPAAVTPEASRYHEQWYLPQLRLPEAWEATQGAPTVRIGVLDDGIDGKRHEFVAGRVGAGWDAAEQTPIPANADSDLGGHGTAVAGFAGASGIEGDVVAGVDRRATLVPIRVTDHEGCISESAYLEGLRWALEEGDLDVLNISLGGAVIPARGDQPGEPELIAALTAGDGTVVVAAMGNAAPRDTEASFPAALPETIAVGGTGPDDLRSPFSSRGRHIDVVAPGGDGSRSVGGDLLAMTDPTYDGDAYIPLAGTSFSTPLVTGVAALYQAAHPDASVADTVRAITMTARDLGAGLAGFDVEYGFGLVDAAAAVAQPTGQLSTRLAGADRFATAAATSQRVFANPSLVDVVLLATGGTFPDALAGAPLAAREHAPLLLTVRDELPAATLAELLRLEPERVVLLGGEAAIGPAVAAQLQQLGFEVVRIAGANRYDTAAQVATGQPPELGETRWDRWTASAVVYVATGESFPDALAGGAAAAALDAPLLLTPKDGLAGPTVAALDWLRPTLVVVLGGANAVSDTVVTQLRDLPWRPAVARAAGADRYETAIKASCAHPLVCVTDTRHVVVATGADFADALGGGAAAAALRAPLVLVPPTGALPPAVEGPVRQLAPEHAIVLGGARAVGADVEQAVRDLVVR